MRPTTVLSAFAFGILSARAQATAGVPVFFTFGNGPNPGPCFVADSDTNGAAVRIAPCPSGPVDPGAWTVVRGGGTDTSPTGEAGPITVFPDKCLDVKDGQNTNGALLQIWACQSNNPNQQFNVNRDNSIVWAGKGKCVDLPDGDTTTGTRLQVWDCTNGPNQNQRWTPGPVSNAPVPRAPANIPVLLKTFLVSPRFAPCITAAGNYSGAAVFISSCDSPSPASQRWTVVKGGAYESSHPNPGPSTQITVFGNKCLDLTDGNTTPGTQLQIWECAAESTNPNQQWSFWGDASIQLANSATLSVDLLNSNFPNGNPIIINTKSYQGSQGWNAVSPNN